MSTSLSEDCKRGEGGQSLDEGGGAQLLSAGANRGEDGGPHFLASRDVGWSLLSDFLQCCKAFKGGPLLGDSLLGDQGENGGGRGEALSGDISPGEDEWYSSTSGDDDGLSLSDDFIPGEDGWPSLVNFLLIYCLRDGRGEDDW